MYIAVVVHCVPTHACAHLKLTLQSYAPMPQTEQEILHVQKHLKDLPNTKVLGKIVLFFV